MNVTVNLKDGRSFEFGESAILEDMEARRFVLAQGKVTGGRVTNDWGGIPDAYKFEERSHICYCMEDVVSIELTPEPLVTTVDDSLLAWLEE